MKSDELKKLKSGTDVRGVAVGDKDDITLTDEAVTLITKAFVKFVLEKSGKTRLKIAYGHDSRISAARISALVKDALLSCGVDARYTSLSSTPSMFILLKTQPCDVDASIMITASHLPYDKNGLKFFTPEGGLDGKDIDKILSLAAEGDFPQGKGKYEEKPFMDEYSAILVKTVENACGKAPLLGKKIIVDAGNGAGGFFTEKVLKPLGANTDGSQFLDPDGTFPNHIPNPENKQAIDSLSSAVVKNNADLGIIFDTDVDRAALVDKDGEEINRSSLIALVSAVLLKKKKGVIVTDSVTTAALTDFIEGLGGKHLRYKRGYRNVIDKCIELNANGEYSPLAIETSGHAAFIDNYFLDDGAYLVVRLLISMAKAAKEGKSLTSLISSLARPVEEDEVRIGFSSKSRDYKSEGAFVIEKLKEIATSRPETRLAPDNYEGVRIYFDKEYGGGWLLVRQSVHDPVMPINFESNEKGGNLKKAAFLLKLLENFEFLNTDNLKKFVK